MSVMESPVLTSATLSLAELREVVAGGRTTQYKPTIIGFAKSNEIYLDCMTIFPFQDKKIDSVFNSFNNNLKVLKSENPQWPDIEVRKVNDMVLLINNTLLQGATDDQE